MSSPHAQTLTGKVAIVTGSGKGMGKADLLRLAAHGANVVVNYHSSAAAAENVAEEARKFGVKAITVKADVSNPADIAHLFEATKKEFGHIDIVMSNSGLEHFDHIENIKGEDIDRIFNVNVKGQFFVAQAAYKHLEDNGRLILISSVSAVWGVQNHAIYGASKAAIQGMVRNLAIDFAPRGITVNCIAPGGIVTDMYTEAAAKYFPEGEKMTKEEIDEVCKKLSPMKRLGYPDDVAGVVSLIASPESQWMTGQTFHVDGGAFFCS